MDVHLKEKEKKKLFLDFIYNVQTFSKGYISVQYVPGSR